MSPSFASTPFPIWAFHLASDLLFAFSFAFSFSHSHSISILTIVHFPVSGDIDFVAKIRNVCGKYATKLSNNACSNKIQPQTLFTGFMLRQYNQPMIFVFPRQANAGHAGRHNFNHCEFTIACAVCVCVCTPFYCHWYNIKKITGICCYWVERRATAIAREHEKETLSFQVNRMNSLQHNDSIRWIQCNYVKDNGNRKILRTSRHCN